MFSLDTYTAKKKNYLQERSECVCARIGLRGAFQDAKKISIQNQHSRFVQNFLFLLLCCFKRALLGNYSEKYLRILLRSNHMMLSLSKREKFCHSSNYSRSSGKMLPL